MMKKIKITHILLLLICLLQFLPGKSQLTLSLQKCREMACEYSKEIKIASNQQKQAAAQLVSVRSSFLPSLSAFGLGLYYQKQPEYKIKGGYLPSYKTGSDGKLYPDVLMNPETQRPVIGADGKPIFNSYAYLPDIRLKLGLRGIYTIGAQLEQAIYMGGKIRTAYKMARKGIEIAEDNLRLQQEDIILSTDRAYWQLLQVSEQVLAAESYLNVVSSLVENLKNSKDVGMSTTNEVLKAEVRLNDARLMLQKAENGRRLASMNLCQIIGLNLYTKILLQDTLGETIPDYIWSLDSSWTQRPDYRLLQEQEEIKSHQVYLTRADFLPQLGVTAGYGYSGGLKLNGEDESSASFSALAALKIPIFHWGEGRNKVKAARLEQEASSLSLEQATDMMQLEIASTRFALRDAQTRVTLAHTALRQANENLDDSRNQYQVGMETLTNLLEAQAQWQQAWSNWIDAKANLHISITQYLKAIGRL